MKVSIDHKATPTTNLNHPYSKQFRDTLKSLPHLGPKRLSRLQRRLPRLVVRLERAGDNVVAPPHRRLLLRKLQRDEDEDRAKRETDVETGGGEVVVVRPPAAVPVSEELVEDETDDAPGRVVERGGGRDLAGAAEDEGHVDVAEGGAGEHAREHVEDGWGDGADEEEVQQVVVHLASGEDALRTDQTPNDGSVEEHAAVGAGEVRGVMLIAQVADGTKGPVEHGDLDNAGPDRGGKLAGEEHAGRHLHVVTKLQVGGKCKTLGHGDVSIRLKQHHGDGAARLHITDDELGNDVETELNVGDGLDHTDRNHEEQ